MSDVGYNADAWSSESFRTAVVDGTNFIEYMHDRRSDYVEQGLSYLLIDKTNLMDSICSTNAQDQVIVGPAVNGYEPVYNRYLLDVPAGFFQLRVQQD